MSSSRLIRVTAAAAALLLSTGLAACGSGEDTAPETETGTETATSTSSAPPAATTTEASSPTVTTSTEEDPGETPTSPTTAGRDGARLSPEVEAVYEEFSSLAPRAVFEQFESCNPTGIEKSFECSGSEVGQFQFFSSASKAASTTQLLTELRSSRVVEDTGRRVVGWSTLGTTAVITVVDNDEGLVMQQMVSSDQVDPEEQIHELGLVEHAAAEDAGETTAAN